jgi:hypothetical protein
MTRDDFRHKVVFHDRLGCVVVFMQGGSPLDLLPQPHEDRTPPAVQFLQGSKAKWKNRR